MRLVAVKNVVGIFFVGLHIAAITACFVFLKSEMESIDFRTVLFIVSPVASVYALAYLRDLYRNMFGVPQQDQRKVRAEIAWLSILISAFFGLYIIWSIVDFSRSSEDPDVLKLNLALVEVFAGAFMGIVFESIFSSTFVPPPNDQTNGDRT